MQFENEKSEYSRQVTELRNTIDTVKENSERQVLCLICVSVSDHISKTIT